MRLLLTLLHTNISRIKYIFVRICVSPIHNAHGNFIVLTDFFINTIYVTDFLIIDRKVIFY